MQSIIMAVLGVMFTVIASYQVSPSVIKYIQGKKADNLIEKEKAIFDAVKRYVTIKGTIPANAQALVDEGYIDSSVVNDNGWGNPITLVVNSSTGVVTLETDIPNEDGKSAYLTSWKHWIKPTNPSGDKASNNFVIPTDVLHGNAGGILSGATISDAAPDPATTKFWYDTSSGKSVLKMSNGTTWTPATVATTSSGGLPPVTSENTVNNISSLPTSGNEEGDVRYVYNAGTNSIDTYTYYGTTWSMLGSSTSTLNATLPESLITTGAYASSFLGLLETGQPTQSYVNDDGSYERGATRIFKNNGDYTITDIRTGLMWQNQPCENESRTFTYDDAIAYCDNLSLAGYDDWVLPNFYQLFSTVAYDNSAPYAFPEFTYYNTRFWSSTPYAPDTSKGFIVMYSNGFQNVPLAKSSAYNVRCVRGAK